MITRYANVPTKDLIKEAENSYDDLILELAQRLKYYCTSKWVPTRGLKKTKPKELK